jgi:hypothetical protein
MAERSFAGQPVITALSDITGSFESGVAESVRVLAVKGKVLPATLHDVRLVAEVQLPDQNSEVRQGKSKIPESGGRIHHVWLERITRWHTHPRAGDFERRAGCRWPGVLYQYFAEPAVPDLADSLRASMIEVLCLQCRGAARRDRWIYLRDHLRNLEKHLGKAYLT